MGVALDVGVERGMEDGDPIVFRGMGEHIPNKIPGDVVLKVAQKKHSVFVRAGTNLRTQIDITLKEALLGFERTIVHLDGRRLIVSSHSVMKPFGVLHITGQGMPHKGDATAFGDLFVKCRIMMPSDGNSVSSTAIGSARTFPDDALRVVVSA